MKNSGFVYLTFVKNQSGILHHKFITDISSLWDTTFIMWSVWLESRAFQSDSHGWK